MLFQAVTGKLFRSWRLQRSKGGPCKHPKDGETPRDTAKHAKIHRNTAKHNEIQHRLGVVHFRTLVTLRRVRVRVRVSYAPLNLSQCTIRALRRRKISKSHAAYNGRNSKISPENDQIASR